MCVHEYLINEKKKHRMFFLELPFLIRHIHFWGTRGDAPGGLNFFFTNPVSFSGPSWLLETNYLTPFFWIAVGRKNAAERLVVWVLCSFCAWKYRYFGAKRWRRVRFGLLSSCFGRWRVCSWQNIGDDDDIECRLCRRQRMHLINIWRHYWYPTIPFWELGLGVYLNYAVFLLVLISLLISSVQSIYRGCRELIWCCTAIRRIWLARVT